MKKSLDETRRMELYVQEDYIQNYTHSPIEESLRIFRNTKQNKCDRVQEFPQKSHRTTARVPPTNTESIHPSPGPVEKYIYNRANSEGVGGDRPAAGWLRGLAGGRPQALVGHLVEARPVGPPALQEIRQAPALQVGGPGRSPPPQGQQGRPLGRAGQVRGAGRQAGRPLRRGIQQEEAAREEH